VTAPPPIEQRVAELEAQGRWQKFTPRTSWDVVEGKDGRFVFAEGWYRIAGGTAEVFARVRPIKSWSEIQARTGTQRRFTIRLPESLTPVMEKPFSEHEQKYPYPRELVGKCVIRNRSSGEDCFGDVEVADDPVFHFTGGTDHNHGLCLIPRFSYVRVQPRQDTPVQYRELAHNDRLLWSSYGMLPGDFDGKHLLPAIDGGQDVCVEVRATFRVSEKR
jgi:hypothetical protein